MSLALTGSKPSRERREKLLALQSGNNQNMVRSQVWTYLSGQEVQTTVCATRPSERGRECIDSLWAAEGTGVSRSRKGRAATRTDGKNQDLEMLATDPKYQGKGAGSMMMRWGLEQADEQCTEAYLEASPDAVPLYEKFGFREAGRTDTFINNERVNGMWYRNLFVIRPAKASVKDI